MGASQTPQGSVIPIAMYCVLTKRRKKRKREKKREISLILLTHDLHRSKKNWTSLNNSEQSSLKSNYLFFLLSFFHLSFCLSLSFFFSLFHSLLLSSTLFIFSKTKLSLFLFSLSLSLSLSFSFYFFFWFFFRISRFLQFTFFV